MIRLVLLLLLGLPGLALAQETTGAPSLEMVFDETDAVPGQPLTLRLTVYVPTFMPRPPVWPTFEAPNLHVRERSSGPVSKRVGGETLSGISRRYEISPMVPGNFALPPQDVVVTYADPQSSEPVKVVLETEPVSLRGIIPEGAEDLDPFIAATGLELEQTIEGDPALMAPGDSVMRTVTATIEGVPSLFIPQLLSAGAAAGLAAYPAEPVTADNEHRGEVRGTRTESVVYVAEGGGLSEAPPVAIRWWDLGANAVRTTGVDGFAIVVDGPPAQSADAPPRDWRIIGVAIVAGLVGLTLFGAAVHRLVPVLRRTLAAQRARHLGSERYAWARLRAAVKGRDHAHLYSALDRWAARLQSERAGIDPRRCRDVDAALLALGAAHYGGRPAAGRDVWGELERALPAAHRKAHRRPTAASTLPPLNPLGGAA